MQLSQEKTALVKMEKWKIIIFMGLMMMQLVNAQLSATLKGVKLQTSTDFLDINITNPFKLGSDITSLTGGYNSRNETYYPYIRFKVVNPNFWIKEANFTDLVKCTSGGDEVPNIQCQELNYTKNVTKKLHFALGFNRDITKEYIEGWDWHKISLGKNYFFDADFRCYFNTSKGSNLSVGIMYEKRNTKTNQIDIDVEFNFTGVEVL